MEFDELDPKDLDFNASVTKKQAEESLKGTEYDRLKKASHEQKSKKATEINHRVKAADRLKKYQFKKGVSANPGGVRKVWSFYQARVQDLTPQIIDRLIEILREGSDKDGLKAAELLLERAWGKATEQIHVNHTGSAIPIINITVGNSPQPERTIDITPKTKKAKPTDAPKALPEEPLSLEIQNVEPPTAQENTIGVDPITVVGGDSQSVTATTTRS